MRGVEIAACCRGALFATVIIFLLGTTASKGVALDGGGEGAVDGVGVVVGFVASYFLRWRSIRDGWEQKQNRSMRELGVGWDGMGNKGDRGHWGMGSKGECGHWGDGNEG